MLTTLGTRGHRERWPPARSAQCLRWDLAPNNKVLCVRRQGRVFEGVEYDFDVAGNMILDPADGMEMGDSPNAKLVARDRIFEFSDNQ